MYLTELRHMHSNKTLKFNNNNFYLNVTTHCYKAFCNVKTEVRQGGTTRRLKGKSGGEKQDEISECL